MKKSINARIKQKVEKDGAAAVEKWTHHHRTLTRLYELQETNVLVYTVYLPHEDDEGKRIGFLPEATYANLNEIRRDFITPEMKVHILFMSNYEELKQSLRSSHDALVVVSCLE